MAVRKWLVWAVLALAGCEAAPQSDITPDMTFQQALDTALDSCLTSLDVTGSDTASIQDKVEAAERCDRNATAVLDGIPSSQWTNPFCRQYVESHRELARWVIREGPSVFTAAGGEPASEEMRQSYIRSASLQAQVSENLTRCREAASY